MNLAGYIRVSTEGQVDAYGKDVQRDAIRTWALLNGHTVGTWFEEDGVSGKTDGGARPELSLAVARAGEFDGIVVFDATRIARRLLVQETLLSLVWAAGLRVFTTTAGELEEDDDDPTRILIRQILGVIAEFDHRQTVKKLHAGRKVKSSQGGYIGGTAPYGLKVQGVGKMAKFVQDEVESDMIRRIRTLYDQCGSYNLIASSLNMMDIPTKRGKRWTAVQVSRIIKRHENI